MAPHADHEGSPPQPHQSLPVAVVESLEVFQFRCPAAGCRGVALTDDGRNAHFPEDLDLLFGTAREAVVSCDTCGRPFLVVAAEIGLFGIWGTGYSTGYILPVERARRAAVLRARGV